MQLDWETINEDQQAVLEHQCFSEEDYWYAEEMLRETQELREELE